MGQWFKFQEVVVSHRSASQHALPSAAVIVSSRKWPLALHFNTHTRHAHSVPVATTLQAVCSDFLARVKLKEKADTQKYMNPFLLVFHNNATSRWQHISVQRCNFIDAAKVSDEGYCRHSYTSFASQYHGKVRAHLLVLFLIEIMKAVHNQLE